ncbi:MAG: hypothetical protein Q8K58_13465 [Acidimicrobiales bacterium]|nr:hypothetical protein [Acidimicrobiales bacterium]
MSRVAVVMGSVLGVVLLLAAAIVGDAAPARAEPVPGRVLVLSLPTLSWVDLHAGDTPHLDALVDQSAIAALSVRDVEPLTDAVDGYATVNAGTRARGVALSGQVMEPDEDFLGTPAADVLHRNTGRRVVDGLMAFAVDAMERRNGGLAYDAEVGALGEALDGAGVPRAVVANADGLGLLRAPIFSRTAGIALMDEEGLVPGGATSPALLEDTPSAPFGVQLSIHAVGVAFDAAWSGGGVVLVEGSDLERADRYRDHVAPQQEQPMRRAALRHTDDLVGDLLVHVDPERDAVLLISPYHPADQVRLTAAALRAPGIQPGLLQSASTRRPGLVTLVDVAPTILDLAGAEAPESMEGRRFERAGDGAATGKERAADLDEIDQAARYRDRMVAPVALAFVALQALLWFAAAFALSRGTRRARRLVSLAALAMLAYLPATYLAGLVPFHDVSTLAYWGFVIGVAAALAIGASLAGARETLDPLLLVLGGVFGLLVVDMLLGAPLQLNTVFGYSPTVGGRFAGMGNLAYGQFAGAALLLCGLLSRRLAGRSAATAVAFAVLLLAIVIDGMPIWGADVGGVLALVPAVGVTAAKLLDHRLKWRSVLLWGSAALAAVAMFAAIDLSRPVDSRTHLGRLVESIGDNGLGALETVVTRKLGANFGVITSSVWTAMVPIALGFVVYLLWRAPGQVRAIRDTIRECLGGLAVVGLLGFALNDSGIAVPGVMLGVVNASLVYLTVRALPAAGSSPEVPA